MKAREENRTAVRCVPALKNDIRNRVDFDKNFKK